jgi:hypothetical protein
VKSNAAPTSPEEQRAYLETLNREELLRLTRTLGLTAHAAPNNEQLVQIIMNATKWRWERNPVKTATLEQVEAKQEKAVNFLRDVVKDRDKAREIEALSPEEYAEKKKLTISNPRAKSKGKRNKRNPDETAQAGELYEVFHGKAPSEIIRVQESDIGRDTYTALGDLYDMKLAWNGENYKLEFHGCGVHLCSSADKRQLYCVGGDQNCDECLPKGSPDKDIVILGVLKKVSYVTRKKFDKFQESAYEHKFGEEGGEPPMAFYARTQKRIFIAGGTYKVEAPGIID